MSPSSHASEPGNVRIGTSEREWAARALGEHLAAGRLSIAEYGRRITAAYGASTTACLRTLFEDLPEPRPAFLPPPLPPPSAGYHPTYPVFVPPHSDKSKTTAGVLQLVFPFGVGRFYTGHVGVGLAQLLVVMLSCGVGALWPWIDGIILLTSGGTDSYGRRLRH